MRWPHLFFKTRKRPEGKEPLLPAAHVTQTPSLKAPNAVSPSAHEALPPKTPTEAEAPLLTPPVKPSAESVERAMEEADPLRALSRTVGIHLMRRTPHEAAPQTGAASAKISGQSAIESPVVTTPVFAKTEALDEPFIVSPTATAPTSVKLPPPGATNLRRKAKLIDLARMVAPPTPEPAVVPPAFSVAVPTGQILPVGSPTAVPVVDSVQAEIKAAPATVEMQKVRTEETPPVSPAPVETKPVESSPVVAKDRKEFLLTNGERIYGRILSENDEAIYLEHGTLGILTLPRSQIAKRPVEIILINGDRIVGDIMAETHDTLYVRHASLGMLTVPRSHRSARVVEAILKDGDRILGEVLTETETFTIIRSASLGTVTVPHKQVAMMNRKIEQIELKALPALEAPRSDKPAV